MYIDNKCCTCVHLPPFLIFVLKGRPDSQLLIIVSMKGWIEIFIDLQPLDQRKVFFFPRNAAFEVSKQERRCVNTSERQKTQHKPP